MVPTYNCAAYLRQTLETVLSQDPGPDHMQIEVVDDCSTRDDPEGVVTQIGRGRVGFHKQPSNQGATRNFNTCLERSRGQWVQLLHGDDFVLPGFYESYRAIIERNPDVIMVCGLVIKVDQDERWMQILGSLPASASDLVANFGTRQAYDQLGQFAGVVVRRDAYEAVGGFCNLFSHVADWDMWFRLGQHGAVASTTRPYSAYRVHQSSDTSRLTVSATNIREIVSVIQLNHARLGDRASRYMMKWRYARLAQTAEDTASTMRRRGATEGYFNNARWAWMLKPTVRRLLMLSQSLLGTRSATKPAPT
jgi:GT2 family glycosyltransferase